MYLGKRIHAGQEHESFSNVNLCKLLHGLDTDWKHFLVVKKKYLIENIYNIRKDACVTQAKLKNRKRKNS